MGWIKIISPRYAFPSIGTILALGGFVCKERLEQSAGPLWGVLPWGSFAIVLGAVLIGEAWADVKNPTSFLRARWRHWWRCFDVQGHYNASDDRNNRTYLHVTVNLTFVRHIKDADLMLKVYELVREPRHLFNYDLKKELNAKPDNQHKFILAVIPVKEGENAYWGSPDKPTNHYLTDGGKYMAVVCLRSKKHYQEHKIYIEIPQRNGGNFGRLFTFDEHYAVLDWIRTPTLDIPNS